MDGTIGIGGKTCLLFCVSSGILEGFKRRVRWIHEGESNLRQLPVPDGDAQRRVRKMSTALELGREGWQHYLHAARSHRSGPRTSRSDRREYEHLLSRLREAARMLKRRFGVRRVTLFGSLASGAWSTASSDVDLAIEGISADSYWAAWRTVEDIVGSWPVDLIEVETVGEPLRQNIQQNGIEL